MIAERLALRPRKLMAVADFALHFSRCNAGSLALPVLLAVAPALLLAAMVAGSDAFGWWCLLAAVTRLSSAPLTLACADLAVQPTTRLRANLWRALGRLPMLVVVLVADAGLRLVTLGLAAPLFQFANEVVLLERGGLGAAVSRSRKLLASAPMRMLAMAALGLAIPTWGAFCGDQGFDGLLDLWSVPHTAKGLVDNGVSGPALVGAALAEAGWTIIRFLAYLDCRTRGEGWDLQLQCQALVERHRATPVRGAA